MGKTGKRGRKNIPSVQEKSLQHSFKLNESPFRWSFRNAIWSHDGWSNCQNLQSFVESIINKLQDYETQTWQDVQSASGGKSSGKGSNSHFISASQLPKKEKREFIRLGFMDKYDKVFSLRLSALERLVGVVDMNRFDILWYDPNHSFFPSHKS